MARITLASLGGYHAVKEKMKMMSDTCVLKGKNLLLERRSSGERLVNFLEELNKLDVEGKGIHERIALARKVSL